MPGPQVYGIALVSLVVLRYGHICVLVGEVGGQGLHVLVHASATFLL